MRRLLLSSSILLVSLGFISSLAHAQAPTPSSGAAPTSPSAPTRGGAAPGSATSVPSEGSSSAADAGAPTAPSTTPAPAPASEEDANAETPYDDEAEPAAGEQPPNKLEAPALSPLDVGGRGTEEEVVDPSVSAERLEQAAPPAPKRRWSLSETVFHLHGYMRLRGNMLREGALGHRPGSDRPREVVGRVSPNQNYDPFPYFTPDDSTSDAAGNAPVARGCGDNPSGGMDSGSCRKKGQVSGDMRLRLKPEIHLSDDVRVKSWIDVFDNVGVGTLGYGADADLSATNAIRARRVWGEARNRDIGELRFGRMGADWGLGIVDNGGDRYGIDSDFSSEVDRIMGMTNLAGFYLMAAYDWARQGRFWSPTVSPSGVPVDRAQRDDLDAVTLSVARKLDDDVQKSAVARGETVFNYGLYFIYRRQFLREPVTDDVAGNARYARFNAKQFVPDLWAQFLWEGLRVELEVAYVAGQQEGSCPELRLGGSEDMRRGATEQLVTGNGTCKFRQLGAALELEYRMFDERLGLHLMGGFASGDSDAYGLAATNDSRFQRTETDGNGDRTISTFGFHPDYRIDLILWRTIMRRVAGAYYVKPGVGYDFIRDPYGQLAGGRVDVIYSRAAAKNQTWGEDANLGLELDVSLYYRSEDGPDLMDGFYGLVQFGVLFPFAGLGYSDAVNNAPNTKNALMLRGVAGIAF